MNNASKLSTLLILGLSGAVLGVACGGSTVGVDGTPSTTGPATEPTPSNPPPSTGASPVTPTPVQPSASAIPCGTATCTAGTQECCVKVSGGGGGGASQTCVAKDTCDGEVALACTSALNCGATQVCCLSVGGGGGTPTATCEASCGGGGGGRALQLCNADAECKTGKCQASQFGIKICTPESTGRDGGPPRRDGGFADGGTGTVFDAAAPDDGT